MKKYSNGSFIDAAVRVYGSEANTLTSFPASIIANGGNITPWTVYGNTVEGESVGDKTNNFFNINSSDVTTSSCTKTVINDVLTQVNTGSLARTSWKIEGLQVDSEYTLSLDFDNPDRSECQLRIYDENNVSSITSSSPSTATTGNLILTFTATTTTHYIRIYSNTSSTANTYTINFSKIMLNTGSTALPYEPHGYKLPVVIGINTTNIYMADVLRKSSGADPVYDIMNSAGIITRNVDTDGTPLVTPTTESFTAPTLATVAGSQSVSFDTTVKPSKAELTYTGWHNHSDKKRSGGAWT